MVQYCEWFFTFDETKNSYDNKFTDIATESQLNNANKNVKKS